MTPHFQTAAILRIGPDERACTFLDLPSKTAEVLPLFQSIQSSSGQLEKPGLLLDQPGTVPERKVMQRHFCDSRKLADTVGRVRTPHFLVAQLLHRRRGGGPLVDADSIN